MRDDKGHKYEIYSYYEHLVAEYLNISVLAVEELNYIDYLYYRRDAIIYHLSRTEKGSEYLDNAWRLEQTKPERDQLRKQFGKEG